MSELSWDNVRDGDGVKVKHKQGGVVEGIFDDQPLSDYIKISGLFFIKDSLELLEHTPAFKNGDICVITSHSTGSNFVGIYLDGAFYSSDSSYRTKVYSPVDEGFTTKIVGNIHE